MNLTGARQEKVFHQNGIFRILDQQNLQPNRTEFNFKGFQILKIQTRLRLRLIPGFQPPVSKNGNSLLLFVAFKPEVDEAVSIRKPDATSSDGVLGQRFDRDQLPFMNEVQISGALWYLF